ncbi:BTB/POZ domain-containing protein 16 [Bagarius yarrelli]|uniref:BTB/POZ domain-containing protein 16 n=1 Tax=Bagarius yarrelli TaxID=175774 RepID=A0A556VW83_BAGYA|nr:BTB/POZ domain-containing protein 16 [Bagarius yarrelli]
MLNVNVGNLQGRYAVQPRCVDPLSQQPPPPLRTVSPAGLRAPGVFLEQPHGRTFAPLFQTLRLYGITEAQLMEELRIIKVLPYSWLHFNFYNIIYSIYSGGNMNITNFSKQSVRFGMIVTQVNNYSLLLLASGSTLE